MDHLNAFVSLYFTFCSFTLFMVVYIRLFYRFYDTHIMLSIEYYFDGYISMSKIMNIDSIYQKWFVTCNLIDLEITICHAD
jgi:hypothetical protein